MCFVLVCFIKVNVNAIGGPLGSWKALLMSPKGRNASRDGFVNLHISLNGIVFVRKPRAFRTRFVVLFLVYKTLSIDRNHLELAIKYKKLTRVFVLFYNAGLTNEYGFNIMQETNALNMNRNPCNNCKHP